LQHYIVHGVLQMPDKLLRLPAVMDRVALRRTAIYAGIKAGTFPAPVAIGKRAVAWRESDIQAWLDSRQLAVEAKAVRGLAGKILRGELPTSI
jgi:prophage regulatory protein